MNPLLLTVGLLMTACAVTLFSYDGRSWLVNILRGVGIQAMIGLGVAAVCVVTANPLGDGSPLLTRAARVVHDSVFHTGGWTARSLYMNLHPDTMPENNADDYLPIMLAQTLVVAMLMAWRKMRDEAMFDVAMAVLVVLSLVNAIVNATALYWWV
jgi:hypothetical protein